MKAGRTRRQFVRDALITVGGAAAALGRGAERGPLETPMAPVSGGVLPRAKIGSLEVSRLLLGGNLLTHYTHSRELQYVYRLAARYNTDEKILETLAVADGNGVNTLCIHNAPHAIALLKRYRRERGGKIQWIICPTAPVEADLAQYRQEVRELVRDGADAIYLWGVHSDTLVAEGKVDHVKKAVAFARSLGVPSGVGAHSLEVIRVCEERGVGADFYIKTFHHHGYPSAPKADQLTAPYNEYPGYWCSNPTETAEFMKTVEKPWIAFKVMAAGAIPPANAFRYAFQNGADCVLAGMFDFEVAEDVRIACDTLAAVKHRSRPWMA